MLASLEKPMPEAKQNQFWKKAFWLLLKIYATLCTLLFSVYLGWVVWLNFFEAQDKPQKTSLQFTYDWYMRNEYPKRGVNFEQLTGLLDEYGTKNSSLFEKEVIRYLGKPDHVYGNTNNSAYLYLYQPWDQETNKSCFYIAYISDGKFVKSVSGDNTIDPINVIASNHIDTVTNGSTDTNRTAH